MNNLPSLYICLIILFSGIATFAVLQLAYSYIRLPQKETLSSLLFSFTAFIYITCDMLGLFFSFVIPKNSMLRFFIILRELTPLLFLIIIPYYINILASSTTVKKINRVAFWAGAASSTAIITAVIISPALLVNLTDQSAYGYYAGIINHNYTGNIQIYKNVLLILCLLYAIGIISYTKTREKHFNSIKNIYIGFIILCYFTFSNLYFNLFTENRTGFFNVWYPHFALGIIIFGIFIIFNRIDVFINYYNNLITLEQNQKEILYFDAALGIPNRIGFIKDLQSELNGIEVKGGNFSLIFIDIDDFQNFNNCFGEKTGNEILKMLSHRLIDYFSSAGSLYRVGGDDFVFLLKDINSLADAKNIAGKIIASFRNSFIISGDSYLITASIGILQIPYDGKNTEDIFNNAYSVIRSAKKIKNSFEVFTPVLLDDSSKKIHIINILRNSIDRDEFTLFYQPIVDTNEKLIHAESLLRCTNSDPSIGGPGIFIPLIEQAGLMKEVDNMVIRKAFHDMEMRIKKRFSISINMSTNQLINPEYCDFLSSFARQHGIMNRQIILEITEDKLMENMATGSDNLLKLKNSGFIVAIDDFGKGFSSLAYLAELPVDILKMDMAFVHAVPGNSKKEAMARHIIELAHSLNLRIIAEGFEKKEQFEFFKGLGCGLFQGYYFSRPVPLDKLLAQYPD